MSPTSRSPILAIGLAALSTLVLSSTGARAQAGCDGVASHLEQRKSISASLSAGGKKQLDAKVACAGFTKLVKNGVDLLKWSETNKEWCSIPDSFVEAIKADHVKAVAIKAKACTIAAKIETMEKQAKSGGGGGGLLGGGGLTGPTAMPQGAL